MLELKAETIQLIITSVQLIASVAILYYARIQKYLAELGAKKPEWEIKDLETHETGRGVNVNYRIENVGKGKAESVEFRPHQVDYNDEYFEEYEDSASEGETVKFIHNKLPLGPTRLHPRDSIPANFRIDGIEYVQDIWIQVFEDGQPTKFLIINGDDIRENLKENQKSY